MKAYNKLVKAAKTKHLLLSWSIIIILMLPSYNFYVNGIIQYRLNMGSISAISYILMAIVGILAYIKKEKKKKDKTVIIVIMLILGTIISYLMYHEIRTVLFAQSINPLDSQAVVLFLYCVPVMILASQLSSWEYALGIIAKLSMVLVPIAILSYWIQVQTLGVLEIDYMSISSFLVFPVCSLCSYGLLKKKWYPFIIALVGVAYIFISGSRGSLICSLISFFYCLYRLLNNHSVTYRIVMIVVMIAGGIYFSAPFFQSAEDVADTGFSRGRTLAKIEEGSFFISQGREEINKVVESGIWENPFGYGLFGDRYIMVKGGLPPTYCHSIIREFLCDFGVIVGSFLLLYLLYALYRTHKRISDKYAYEVLVMVVCSGFVHLLFSSTFLADYNFWTMIGVIINPYIKGTFKKDPSYINRRIE